MSNDASQNERCVCGRDKKRVHCPFCGLRNCYAIATMAFKIPRGDGTDVKVSTFRCRGCDSHFNDLDRERCQAPVKQLSMKAVRVMDAAFENLTPEERRKLAFDKLRDLQKQKEEVQ